MNTTTGPNFEASVETYKSLLVQLAEDEFDGHMLKAAVALGDRVATTVGQKAVVTAFSQLSRGGLIDHDNGFVFLG